MQFLSLDIVNIPNYLESYLGIQNKVTVLPLTYSSDLNPEMLTSEVLQDVLNFIKSGIAHT